MASASFTRVTADYVRFKLTGGNTAYYYTFQHKSGNSWVSDVSNKTGKTSYSFDIYTGSAGVYCRIVQASRSGGSVTYFPSSSGQYVDKYVEQITYKVRLVKYVDNSYQAETTFTTTSQIMSEAAVKKQIPSSWASSDIKLNDPWFGTLTGCRYDQYEGEFTFTSTSPTINVAYTKIVVTTYNYYLRYHANGGTGGPNDQSTLGTTVTSVPFKVPSTEPTRKNYTFLGWSFDSTATKADYVGGDIVTLNSEKPDRTLYAIWKYTPKYNYYLRYNANGGTGGPNDQSNLETTDTTVTFRVPSTKPTRTGYTFLGWSFDYTATKADYVGGNTVTLYSDNSDRTLYAVWKIAVIKPTITYVSHTDTTIKISLDRNDATTGSWIIEASLSNFGTIVYTTTITNTTQTTITLTGLTPETTYYIRARHVNGDVSVSSNVISATTRTSTFQWTSDDSRYVVKDAVFTDVITAAKWKELIKKVNWCRKKKGLSVVSLNDAVRGQPILAKDFTDMRNAIADMHAVTPAREPDDEILATYFANSDTSLKSAINAVITTL